MKIALIGYGSMGQAVERVAVERGHEIAAVRDPSSGREDSVEGCDVAIDFSLGDAVEANGRMCAAAGVPLVIGSTGWYEREEAVKAACGLGDGADGAAMDEAVESVPGDKIPVMWSSNFSIGVNLFFRVIEAAAKMIDKFDEYDVWGTEIHHYNKADSPSGTAKVAGKILLDNIKRKTALVDEKLDRRREDNEIHFSSVRGGAVNFGHTIGFDSAADRILITHEARCRDGYALGAVKAAEWLCGGADGPAQEPGWYGMEDFLSFS